MTRTTSRRRPTSSDMASRSWCPSTTAPLRSASSRAVSQQRSATSRHWELIFVVDGSPDQSWSVVEQLVAAHPQVVGVELFRNFGQHNALLAGIRLATFDVVVTMDDDLQHRPETIPSLLAALTDRSIWCTGRPSRRSTAPGEISPAAWRKRRWALPSVATWLATPVRFERSGRRSALDSSRSTIRTSRSTSCCRG